MSKEYLKHIFEPFSQERNDSGSTQQGIGLGMSIVKGLIEKMGGTIKIKSDIDYIGFYRFFTLSTLQYLFPEHKLSVFSNS